MRPELIVAEKEFRDYLTSMRVIAIFIILMLLAIFGMINSMDQYNKSLDDYKKNLAEYQQQPEFKDQAASLQKQITDLEANGGSADQIRSLRQRLDLLANPPMPSLLSVFGGVNNSGNIGGGYFSIILILLAMALGFDLITRERDEGSLKSLLSHPVYRDSVILGKLIGAMSILVVIMGSVFVITIVIMMFYGAKPTLDDLARFGAFFVMAMLYTGVLFAISAMFSTISKSSAMSILCILAVIIAFILLPTFTPSIASAILGPAPEMYNATVSQGSVTDANSLTNSTAAGTSSLATNNSQLQPDPAYYTYYLNRFMITDTINTISPEYDFDGRIASAILYKESASTGPMPYARAVKYSMVYQEPSLLDSLAYVWIDILVLLVMFIVPISVTCILFMRMDVR